jgi:hypothetical protein
MKRPPHRHLHLHVISSDLCAPALKTKRHYNSFSLRVGFFVPLDEVRAWLDDEQHELAKVSFVAVNVKTQFVLMLRCRIGFDVPYSVVL